MSSGRATSYQVDLCGRTLTVSAGMTRRTTAHRRAASVGAPMALGGRDGTMAAMRTRVTSAYAAMTVAAPIALYGLLPDMSAEGGVDY